MVTRIVSKTGSGIVSASADMPITQTITLEEAEAIAKTAFRDIVPSNVKSLAPDLVTAQLEHAEIWARFNKHSALKTTRGFGTGGDK